MIDNNISFYAVDGFGQGGDGHNGWGFFVRLDMNFAKKFYDIEIPEEQLKRLDENGKSIISGIWRDEEKSMIDTPYSFFRNSDGNQTFLLQYCRVLGNACDLGVEGTELKELKGRFEKWDELRGLVSKFPMNFTSHNVNSFQNAAGLFAIWAHWYETAYCSILEDN